MKSSRILQRKILLLFLLIFIVFDLERDEKCRDSNQLMCLSPCVLQVSTKRQHDPRILNPQPQLDLLPEIIFCDFCLCVKRH